MIKQAHEIMLSIIRKTQSKTKTTGNYFPPTRMAKIERQTVTRRGNDHGEIGGCESPL